MVFASLLKSDSSLQTVCICGYNAGSGDFVSKTVGPCPKIATRKILYSRLEMPGEKYFPKTIRFYPKAARFWPEAKGFCPSNLRWLASGKWLGAPERSAGRCLTGRSDPAAGGRRQRPARRNGPAKGGGKEPRRESIGLRDGLHNGQALLASHSAAPLSW